MIPRIDLLIADSRIASLQRDYGEEYGIDQEFFVGAINRANVKLQRYLVKEMSEPLAAYEDIPVVAGSSIYDAPSNIFAHNLIYDVWYSRDGSENGFGDPMEQMSVREYGSSGYPSQWIADSGKIYLDSQPVDSGGILRVRFEKRLDRLNIRRGVVESATLSAGGLLTALDLDAAATTHDSDALGAAEYVCIVDNFGTIKARNIKVLSYNSSTGAYTLPSGGDQLDEDSEIDAGDWVLPGADTTTHTTLPDCVEDFYIDFTRNEVHGLLSEDEEISTTNKFKDQLSEIAEIYSQLPSGKIPIPQRRGSC